MSVDKQLKGLIGEDIYKIYISEDDRALKFETDDKYLIYRSCGECCAFIYFADIEYPSRNRKSYRVRDVVEIEEYGYRIKTDAGDIVISGRYSSSSGWDGYAVGCDLIGITPKENEEYQFVEFKQIP